MSLDDSYLRYPKRQYGMDHEHYTWSMLSERKAVTWPNQANLAVWVNINIQLYPLNQQKNAVAVPGGLTMPYPDLRHYSLRDYGNRVGIYRILKALDQYSITPTIAINGAMVEKAPYLMDLIRERGDEVIAHGWKMDELHSGELEPEAEKDRITRTIETLQNRFQNRISGWLSPGRLQTRHTQRLLVEQGIHYNCDWVNDDMPYHFNTDRGKIICLPLSNELDDFFVLNNNLHRTESYAEQMEDACDFLLNEATQNGGRLLALNIHPWLMGQPHRIAAFERILAHIASQQKIFNASARDIIAAWENQ